MFERAMLPPTARRCDVRQNLAIHSTRDRRELAVAMHNAAAPPWRVTHPAVDTRADRPEGPCRLFFQREPLGDLKDVRLYMFEIPDGYELVSLTESGRNLSRTPWNELTDEFIETCVVPAMDSSEDFSWNLGAREDGPEDWLSQIAVKHLCGSLADGCNPAANWGSPAAKSWLKFLISVHEDGDQLEYGQFIPWLKDVEGWNSRDAIQLFECSDTALRVLFEYERSRGPLRHQS